MSKEYTKEEILNNFIRAIWDRIDYWESEIRTETSRDKLEGLAFSILSILDGCAMDLPAFIIAPDPHPDDKGFCQEQGENWYPENHDIEIKGSLDKYQLHEAFYNFKNDL